MLKREWFSAAEVAEMNLPDLPGKRGFNEEAKARGWRRADMFGRWWRHRPGRGGGYEYHYSVLPSAARAAWIHIHNEVDATREQAASEAANSPYADRWKWFHERPQKIKEEAKRRFLALDTVWRQTNGGIRKDDAVAQTCSDFKISVATYYNWEKLISTVGRHDWLPFLAPQYKGRTAEAECTDEAWEVFKADYLTLSRPTAEECYRKLAKDAEHRGWTIPSLRTIQRRIKDLDPRIVASKRYGKEALDRQFPAQERDRTCFHAMQAVNADGHRFDVFVKWPDGKISRPLIVAFQDLYSGMIVSWRMGRNETSELVRLAYGDMAEKYAIPPVAYFDNGRAFAAKENTGGTPTRYRGKVKPEDPVGALVQCGTQVEWITPYRGQAKPIERAFKDFAMNIARDSRCVGAWTGNNPMAKPENYGSKAVPIEEFHKIVHEGIVEHNSRPGRQTDACKGKLSFRQAFEQSFSQVQLPRLSETQRPFWYLASEGIKAHKESGSLRFYGNRFWDEPLVKHAGQHLTIRFDPDDIQAGLHVFDNEGRFVCLAPCVAKVGYNDKDGARRHAAAKGRFKREGRELARAEVSLSLEDVARLRAPVEEPAPPIESKVVRLVTRGATALQPRPIEQEEEEDERISAALLQAVRRGPNRLKLVTDED